MPRVAIVGSGLIGGSWAIVFASGGWEVALYDAAPGAADKALGRVRDGLQQLASHRLVADPDAAMARVRAAGDLEDALSGASLVQENVAETLEAKRAIFAELDRAADPEAILASSSSFIVASKFAEDLAGRRRCLVAHPVNPPHLVPVVELVGAPFTTQDTIQRAKQVYEGVGQVPIVVKREIEGFILNRLQAVLLSEAFRLVEDGYVSPQDLDKTLKDGLGLRWSFMGPFDTIELNAPGGIPDYCHRYGNTLARVSGADAQIYHTPYVDLVLNEWGEPPPPEKIAERMAWRDRRLAALKAHKRAQAQE
jgi:L-gulonate 3-dehydrogenase